MYLYFLHKCQIKPETFIKLTLVCGELFVTLRHLLTAWIDPSIAMVQYQALWKPPGQPGNAVIAIITLPAL